jgi:radical SAM superfamily enzyme YgiQ (UPF0313 family)
MRVLLISPNREEINMRTLPLGLACVAAATKKAGHEVTLTDLMETEDPAGTVQQVIEDFRPEAIGLSVRNIDDQKMTPARFLLEQTKEIVDLCREHSEAPIILGGAGYSIFPESALAYLGADMGIQGEGEALFPLLLNRLSHREDLAGFPGLYLPAKGLQGQRAFISHLDELPWKDVFSWFRFNKKIQDYWVTVQTRRGCPMGCSYCSTETIEGRTIRRRDPREVADELAAQMEAGVEQFYFTDNTFNLPADYALELCRGLTFLKGKARWRGIIYPGKIDQAVARAMAESGCVEVSIGFESGSPGILRSLNKFFSLEEVRRTFEILGEYGIRRMGFLLLGGPGETRETVMESLAFADSLPLEALKVTAGIRIYPETPLAAQALAEGVIRRETNLLSPTYYLAGGLERWLNQTVSEWLAARPHWMM